MQHLSGTFGGSSGGGKSSATVLVSPVAPELTDRMYADLVNALVYSRDSAEKRANEAEARLHELHMKLLPPNGNTTES